MLKQLEVQREQERERERETEQQKESEPDTEHKSKHDKREHKHKREEKDSEKGKKDNSGGKEAKEVKDEKESKKEQDRSKSTYKKHGSKTDRIAVNLKGRPNSMDASDRLEREKERDEERRRPASVSQSPTSYSALESSPPSTSDSSPHGPRRSAKFSNDSSSPYFFAHSSPFSSPPRPGSSPQFNYSPTRSDHLFPRALSTTASRKDSPNPGSPDGNKDNIPRALSSPHPNHPRTFSTPQASTLNSCSNSSSSTPTKFTLKDNKSKGRHRASEGHQSIPAGLLPAALSDKPRAAPLLGNKPTIKVRNTVLSLQPCIPLVCRLQVSSND